MFYSFIFQYFEVLLAKIDRITIITYKSSRIKQRLAAVTKLQNNVPYNKMQIPYYVVHYEKRYLKTVTALKGENKLNIKSPFFIMKGKFHFFFQYKIQF